MLDISFQHRKASNIPRVVSISKNLKEALNAGNYQRQSSESNTEGTRTAECHERKLPMVRGALW